MAVSWMFISSLTQVASVALCASWLVTSLWNWKQRSSVLPHNQFLWYFQLPFAVPGVLMKWEAWQGLRQLFRNPSEDLAAEGTVLSPAILLQGSCELAKGYIRWSSRWLWFSTTTFCWPPCVGPAICKGSQLLMMLKALGILKGKRLVLSLPCPRW